MDFTDSESQSEQNDVPVPNVVGKLEKMLLLPFRLPDLKCPKHTNMMIP